jgi:hypothetical protein
MWEMNQPENRRSDAMRRLNSMPLTGAPAALGDMLKEEFRRHHARRRRDRIARVSLLAACLVAAVGLSITWLRTRKSITVARHEVPETVTPSVPISASLATPVVLQPPVKKFRAPATTRNTPPAEADRFVELPTFDPAIPIDHLEMVRLDLPGRALQLVGFPVSEEFAERQVVADVLLAQDGTPYALRLVRSSETKEQWQ